MISYSNTFDAPFVFDDMPNIVDNYSIKDISNIPDILMGKGGSFASRPLMHVTFALNYYFHGLDTTGYHVVNLLLHLINCALLYALILLTGRHKGYHGPQVVTVALLSSLVFAVHPLNTDAVTYVVSRSVLLAAMFFMLGLILFLKAATDERRRSIYIATLFATSILGMASRESFMAFPLILPLYDLFFISEFRPKAVAKHSKIYVPVLISLLYMFYLVVNNDYARPNNLNTPGIPPLNYALTQFRVHWTSLRLIVFPISQTIDYDYPIAQRLMELPVIMSLAGYIGVWAGSVYLAKRRALISFGVLWFLIALLPISFLVAFMDLKLGNALFEHRLYLPSIGIVVALVSCTVALVGGMRGGKVRAAAALISVAILVALSSATYARNSVWQSQRGLWEDAVNKGPNNASAHGSLAIALYNERDLNGAIEHYKEVLRLNPDDIRAYNNLGMTYESIGRKDLAVEQYEKAISLSPHYARGHNNLATLEIRRGRYDKAIEHLKVAISAEPYYADAHFNLGLAYLYSNNIESARNEFETVLRLHPDYKMARSYLNYIDNMQGEHLK